MDDEEVAKLFEGRFEFDPPLLQLHHEERAEFVKSQFPFHAAVTRTVVDKILPFLDRLLPFLHLNPESIISKLEAKCKYYASPYAVDLNDKAFVIRNGKLEEFTPADIKPDAKIIFTANSNLASPIAFARNMITAEGIARERHPDSEIVVIGTYHSRRNFYANGLDSIKRLKELNENPAALEFVSPASYIQAKLIRDLIIDHIGPEVSDRSSYDKPLIKADAAEILSGVSFYGYSGAALTNHDAVRLLRGWLETGSMYIRNKGAIERTGRADAEALIPQITLIGYGAADFAQTTDTNIEPKIIYLMGRGTDASLAAVLGKAPYLGHDDEIDETRKIEVGRTRIISVRTNKGKLGGHEEGEYDNQRKWVRTAKVTETEPRTR